MMPSVIDICRACMTDTVDGFALFDLYETNRTLAAILNEFATTEVYKGDGLPSMLCKSCTEILVKFHNFKIVYEKSEHTLSEIRKVLSSDIIAVKIETLETNDCRDIKKVESNESVAQSPHIFLDANTIENENIKRIIPGTPLATEEDFLQRIKTDDCTNKVINILEADIHGQLKDALHKNTFRSNKYEKVYTTDNEVPNIININSSKLKDDTNRLNCNNAAECEDNTGIDSSQNNFDISAILNKHLDYEVCNISKYTNQHATATDHTNQTVSINKSATEFIMLKETQNGTNQNVFICDICGQVFARKLTLKDHMDTHSKELKYRCKFCDKHLKSRTSLSRHYRLHKSQDGLVCELCGEIFRQLGSLRNHQLIHSKTKNFECSICKQLFAFKGTLNRHIRRHEQRENKTEKKFQCNECNMKYLDDSSLKRHIQMKHLQEVVAKCSMCNEAFYSKISLTRHCRITHVCF